MVLPYEPWKAEVDGTQDTMEVEQDSKALRSKDELWP